MQREQHPLLLQAQVLMNELADVIAAETASSTSDYTLLSSMNQLMERQYADMTHFVQALQPQTEVRS